MYCVIKDTLYTLTLHKQHPESHAGNLKLDFDTASCLFFAAGQSLGGSGVWSISFYITCRSTCASQRNMKDLKSTLWETYKPVEIGLDPLDLYRIFGTGDLADLTPIVAPNPKI